MLFKSLHTLAGQCPAILLTVSRDGADRLRVNVMPKAALDEDGKVKDVANAALFTPISMTGTPEELDAGFGEALTGYTDTRRDLRGAVEDARATMTAAKKTVAPSKPAPAAANAAAPSRQGGTVAVLEKKYTPPAAGGPLQHVSSDLFSTVSAATPEPAPVADEQESAEEPAE